MTDSIFSALGKVKFHKDTVAECYQGSVTSKEEVLATAAAFELTSRNIKRFLAGNERVSVASTQSSYDNSSLSNDGIHTAIMIEKLMDDCEVPDSETQKGRMSIAIWEALSFELFDSYRRLFWMLDEED